MFCERAPNQRPWVSRRKRHTAEARRHRGLDWYSEARAEPLVEECRPCGDSGFIKRAYPALKGWAKLFRPTRWDWNPRLSPETGANLGHRARKPSAEWNGISLFSFPAMNRWA